MGCGFCITWQKICSLNSAVGKAELSRVHSALCSFLYTSFPSLSRDKSPELHGILKSPTLIYTCAFYNWKLKSVAVFQCTSAMEGIWFAGVAAVRRLWVQTKILVKVNMRCFSAL